MNTKTNSFVLNHSHSQSEIRRAQVFRKYGLELVLFLFVYFLIVIFNKV